VEKSRGETNVVFQGTAKKTAFGKRRAPKKKGEKGGQERLTELEIEGGGGADIRGEPQTGGVEKQDEAKGDPPPRARGRSGPSEDRRKRAAKGRNRG